MPRHLFQKGHIKTGGRKKGSKNSGPSVAERRVQASESANREAMVRMEIIRLAPREEIDAALARINWLTPLEVLLACMQLKLERGDVDGALLAAEKAAPYSHAKLNATDVRVQHSTADKDDAAVAAEIENLRAKIQRAQAAPTLIEGSAEPVEVDLDEAMEEPSGDMMSYQLATPIFLFFPRSLSLGGHTVVFRRS